MKKIFLPTVVGLFGLSHAYGQLFSGATETFGAIPPVTSWASKSIAGASGDVSDLNGLTALVNGAGNGIANFTTPLGSTTTSGTSSGPARVNTTTGVLESAPTGVAATLFVEIIQNNTGVDATTASISYDLSKSSTSLTEQVPLEVYYSLTGAVGSWQNVAGLSGEVGTTVVAKQANIVLNSPWANGSPLYFLWADDNASPSADNVYRLDNVTVTAVPEPSAWATAGGLALIGFALVRRVRR